ncbi:MAG: methyltransferase domain-containing protein [Myxococcaceae bacterium]
MSFKFKLFSMLLTLGFVGCGDTPVSQQDAKMEYLDRCMSSRETLLDMEKITIDVSEILTELNMTHWLDSGTLLGAYRFGSHMPYDDDVDFGVLKSEYEPNIAILRQKLSEKGYELAKNTQYEIDQVFYKDNHERAHLDLFLFEPDVTKNNYWRLSSDLWHKNAKHAVAEGLGFPESVIWDLNGKLGRAKILGVEFDAPINLEGYFKRWYPEDKILTSFMITQNHAGGFCSENRIVIKDILEDPNSLSKMFEHLESVYGDRFKRTDSELYLMSQNKIKNWFNEGAFDCDVGMLHHCSQWRYLSNQEYEEMIMDGVNRMVPPLKDSEKIFDLGVGVGAPFYVISKHVKNMTFGGSDIAEKAIEKAKTVFPAQADNFFVHDMTQKHGSIPDNYFDHLVSFGALGMYLTKDQMIDAMKEAVRMTKPGGSMIFTSFIEPEGKRVGSIVAGVEKSFWTEKAQILGIKNVRTYPMLHQGDRYQMLCTKK